MKALQWFWPAMIVVGVAFGVYYAFFNPSSNKIPEARSRYFTSEVQDGCEERIRDQLISPGSARFIADNRPALVPATGMWTWQVGVDSQNQFGALLRSRWACRVVDATGTITVTRLE